MVSGLDGYRSSSGCTHLYGVISRSAVNLIMCTGSGASRTTDIGTFQVSTSTYPGLRVQSKVSARAIYHR